MANVRDPHQAITLRRFSEPAFPRAEIVENVTDRFVMSLPLCCGKVRIQAEGGTIYDGAVRPGMLRITAPGERLHLERQSRAEALVVGVPGALFRRIATEQDYRTAPAALCAVAPIVDPHPQVERLTSALLGLAEIDRQQRPLFLEGITLGLLALALAPHRHWQDDRPRHGLGKIAFDRCIAFADAHLGDKLDIATWAGEIGLPTAEFARRFQATARVAPYTWLLNWRIDRAKQMLDDPRASLAEIAFRVGFSSQSHFSEAFRRRTGIPPGQWRKRNAGESR